MGLRQDGKLPDESGAQDSRLIALDAIFRKLTA